MGAWFARLWAHCILCSRVVPTSVLLEALAETPNVPFDTCTPFFHSKIGSSPSMFRLHFLASVAGRVWHVVMFWCRGYKRCYFWSLSHPPSQFLLIVILFEDLASLPDWFKTLLPQPGLQELAHPAPVAVLMSLSHPTHRQWDNSSGVLLPNLSSVLLMS